MRGSQPQGVRVVGTTYEQGFLALLSRGRPSQRLTRYVNRSSVEWWGGGGVGQRRRREGREGQMESTVKGWGGETGEWDEGCRGMRRQTKRELVWHGGWVGRRGGEER